VINSTQVGKLQFNIQPNPMSQHAVINLINCDKNEKYFLSCQDLNKVTLWTKSFLSNTIQIERENLVPGMYLLSIRNAKQEQVAIDKLIVK